MILIIIISLLISTIISSFVIFTFDMWRVRLQIYSIIKRFYTYYYHLLSLENIFKANKNSDIQECFIDEFGWIVLIKGATIDIISSISTQILYYLIFSPILLWKSKPIEYYYDNNNTNEQQQQQNDSILNLLKNQKENYYSIFNILIISIIIGSFIGMIQYISQYYKIKLQFRLNEKLQTIHKDKKYNTFINPLFCLNKSSFLFYSPIISNKKAINKNINNYDLLNNYKFNKNLNFTEKIIKEGCLSNNQQQQQQQQQQQIEDNDKFKYINSLYSLFGDSLLSVFNEIFYNFLFLSIFNYLNYFQTSIYLNSGSNSGGNDGNSNLLVYLINYIYYRSTILPLLLSSIISVIITHPLVVYQTQLEAFQFSNLLLNLYFKEPPFIINNTNNNIDTNNTNIIESNRKDEDLISYPKKFKKIYLKNKWVGLIGRLLYNPLKIVIISLWFDFILSLF